MLGSWWKGGFHTSYVWAMYGRSKAELSDYKLAFEQSNVTGEFICDHRLWQYTNTCSIDKEAVLRSAGRTFWLGVSYDNRTFEGYIHHRYCPFDYCTSESKHINLNNPDEQCNFKHSGLLCGKCKEGIVLSLAAPNARSVVTVTWLCLFHLH